MRESGTRRELRRLIVAHAIAAAALILLGCAQVGRCLREHVELRGGKMLLRCFWNDERSDHPAFFLKSTPHNNATTIIAGSCVVRDTPRIAQFKLINNGAIPVLVTHVTLYKEWTGFPCDKCRMKEPHLHMNPTDGRVFSLPGAVR